jgi:hypothetical protein
MALRFAPSTRRFLDTQPHNVRSKLINDVVWLDEHHHLAPDHPTIKPFLASPMVMRMFQDDFHWIIFYADGESLIVANIRHTSEIPHLWRAPDP